MATTRPVRNLLVALTAVAMVTAPAAAQVTTEPGTAEVIRFQATEGSAVRLEGTSNLHNWQVQGSTIDGFLEIHQVRSTAPRQTATPDLAGARAEVSIPVRTLKSVDQNGQPFSTTMNEYMYESLKVRENPKILYSLKELLQKEIPKNQEDPSVYESAGELVVAGVTNRISMRVIITCLDDRLLKVSGRTTVKMTQFNITPRTPALVDPGPFKVGDEVTLIFEWRVARKDAQ